MIHHSDQNAGGADWHGSSHGLLSSGNVKLPTCVKSAFRHWVLGLLALSTMAVALPAASEKPVLIGFDTELTLATSTSSEAIRRGLLIAMDEINAAGGVLGGRPLALEIT
ncbi:MAG: hypothetical protein OEV31_00775, partial [Gammaproteobacteria bacterium]|nr:hypothetical protein [Gammaproteobacteria bacterium]